MSRPPVYICAPYTAPTPEERDLNIRRASALARLAVAEGYAPICVHPGIAAIYGDEETPELRAQGLDVDCALVRLVASHPKGEIWVLFQTGGGSVMSEGQEREKAAWLSCFQGRPRPYLRVKTDFWRELYLRFWTANLLDRWEAANA